MIERQQPPLPLETNPSVNRSACKRSLQVSSTLRALATSEFKRECLLSCMSSYRFGSPAAGDLSLVRLCRSTGLRTLFRSPMEMMR